MELKFKNNSIEKYKSERKDFFDKRGRSKPVITSFKMGAKYKGLYLREYLSGAKHFIVRFRLKGNRTELRIFPVGKFDPTLSVKTGEVLFGIKECEERLFSIVKDHCDALGRWTKNPNDTLRFNKVMKSVSIAKVIEAYCKKGFPKIGSEEKIRGARNGIVDVSTPWKNLFETPKTEYDEALENAEDTPGKKYYW